MDLRTWLQARQPSEPPRDAALADFLGITPAAVRHKANGVRAVQYGECPLIEQFTGAQVPCEDLRDDVDWDRDDSGAVTGYRVRFPTAASVDQAPATVEPAEVGGAQA